MVETVLRVSWVTLGLSFAYSSKAEIRERFNASVSTLGVNTSSTSSTSTKKKLGLWRYLAILALFSPSINTLTVPSGSFSSWRICPIVPTV